MLGAFLAACILEINVVYIVIVCGLIGVVRTLLAKRRSGNDLSAIIFKFSANRNVQLRGRLCGHASDPGTSSHDSRMADHVEFTDLITISQITPGPIAVNSATFVGLKIAGIPGAVVATVGCILPSCIIVTILARLYLKYRNLDLLQGVLKSLRPAVVAMIASAGILILKMRSGEAEGRFP